MAYFTRAMSAAATLALLAACNQQPDRDAEAPDAARETAMPAEDTAPPADNMAEPDADMESAETTPDEAAQMQPAEPDLSALSPEGQAKLKSVLADARRDEDRARDEFRHPAEALAFFGIEPGMTVAEALPGGGWYTRVLLPYLTPDGNYIALDYQSGVWEEMYGDKWADKAAEVEAWPETAPAEIAKNGPAGGHIEAYRIGETPEALDGHVDAVLFVRALHHLNRFDVVYLDEAIVDSYAMLKPGGVVGVIQHRAKADASDDYASGDNGYLRQADVISAFERAGFVLADESEMNANPDDSADYEGGVWTLPPTGGGGEDYADIGESDRMTLKFVKPE